MIFVVIVSSFYYGKQEQEGARVFKMTESGLQVYQDIIIKRGHKSSHFEMDGQHFITIAIHQNAATGMYTTNSVIYKWNGHKFVLFQGIPTVGANDIKYFTIDKHRFLCVANRFNGITSVVYSSIQMWNGNRFVHYQNILTEGATTCSAFSINGQHLISFAQSAALNNAVIRLKVLRFSGFQTGFSMIQNLGSFIASDVTYFQIRDNHFLALSNIAASRYVKYNIPSSIYRWNSVTLQFDTFQNINTFGATATRTVEINGETFLGISNFYNDRTMSNVIHSAIYKADGAGFVEYQHVPSIGAKGLDFFHYKGSTYLVVANYKNGNFMNVMSYLYKFK